MRNFYTFLIALVVSGSSFGQGTRVSAGTQPAGTEISSLTHRAADAVDVFELVLTNPSAAATLVTNIRLKPGATNTAAWGTTIAGVTLNNGIDIPLEEVVIKDSYIDIRIASGDLAVTNSNPQTVTIGIYFRSDGGLIDNSILSFLIDADDHGFTADSSGTDFSEFISSEDFFSDSFQLAAFATEIEFIEQPTLNTNVGAKLVGATAPLPRVAYTDGSGTVDTDVSGTVTITSSNSSLSNGSQTTIAVSGGAADLDNLYFITDASGINLRASNILAQDDASASPFPFNIVNLSVRNVDSDPFNINAITPTTYTYDGGWVGLANPVGVSSSSDIINIVSGSTSITADTEAFNVTISAGASLTVDGTIKFNVINKLLMKSTSTSFSSFIFNGSRQNFGSAVGGNISYERWTNSNAAGNDLIAPPTTGQTWVQFVNSDNNSSNLFSGLVNGSTRYLFGDFPKPANSYRVFPDPVQPNPTLSVGRGYRAGTTGSGSTLTFSGDIRTTQINNIAVFHGGNNFPDWNLLGNPYTYYINADSFLSFTNPTIIGGGTNSSLLQPTTGVYAYDAGAQGGVIRYIIITAANASENPIAPGQGFFVAVAPQSATIGTSVVFDPTMINGTQSGDDFIPLRSTTTSELTYLKLKLTKAENFATTEFYFNEDSSLGLDEGYDGRHLQSVGDFALYSHLVQDNSGLEIGLQSMHNTDLSNTTIPLGVNANSGEQLIFSIGESTLPESVDIYLEDTATNTFTPLNTGDYIITPSESLSGTGRFFLRLEDTALSIIETTLDQLSIFTNANERTITIHGQLLESTTANVFDIQGRLVNAIVLSTSNTTHSIDTSNYSPGVYIVQLENDGQSKTQKVIIK